MHDLRLAFRTLRASPAFAAVAIASLALGIGANTAIFSLVNGLLLRGLPVAAPERLVFITTENAAARRIQWAWSYAFWSEIQRRPDLFADAAAWAPNRFDLASGGTAEFVDGLWASGSFFRMLGVNVAAGRAFTESDDGADAGRSPAVAVISQRFAQRRFGTAQAAIGRKLMLDNMAFAVVGVMPPEFHGPEIGRAVDVIAPFAAEPLLRGRESRLRQRGGAWLIVAARLAADHTAASASARLRGAQRAILEATVSPTARPDYRAFYMSQALTLVPVTTGPSVLRDRYRRPLVVLMALVALVLVIACANIATLLTARAAARDRELSVRRALGASRWRLARQLLAESVVLAVPGSACGILLASRAGELVVRQLSTTTDPVVLDVPIDWRVLLFAVAIACAATLFFGVAPALFASRREAASALRSVSPGGGGRGRFSGTVAVQVAVSLPLVVVAGLMIRTFSALTSRDAGFDRRRVLLVGLDTSRTSLAPDRRIATYDEIRNRVAAVPGVAHAAVSMLTPIDPVGALVARVRVSGTDVVPDTVDRPSTFTNVVTPEWFATFGVQLLEGRDFTARDGTDAPRVAIVNRALVRQYLGPGDSAIGRTVTMTLPGRQIDAEIVGVVADAVYSSLREVVPPTLYTPLAQLYISPVVIQSVTLSVRSNTGLMAGMTHGVTDAIARVNPEVSVTLRPFAEQVSASLTQERVIAQLAAVFGMLALCLAAVGLYGVADGFASRRRLEIGIRMALGAAPAAIVRLMLLGVALPVGVGLAAGSVVSLWATTFVGSLLYGLAPRDLATFAGTVVLLSATSAFAVWVPARRASRLQPAQVLREI